MEIDLGKMASFLSGLVGAKEGRLRFRLYIVVDKEWYDEVCESSANQLDTLQALMGGIAIWKDIDLEIFMLCAEIKEEQHD